MDATREALEVSVASLGNKIQVLDGEIKNLQHTREMLDQQLVRQEQQNKELAHEVSNLHTIKEGLQEFAVHQGQSYTDFTNKLEASLNRHAKLIQDFAEQNRQLKENREKIQIDSYLSMINSFSAWDDRAGLSVEEFKEYLEFLGPDFEKVMIGKYGGDLASVFARLDSDGSGSLNIPEVRILLEAVVEELQ